MRRFIGSFFEALERGQRFVTHDVWRIGKPGEELPRGIIIKNVRVVILVIRGIIEEQFLLRASALTFATLLFIVPFLTFMFFFIQAFNLGEGFYGYISKEVDHFLDNLVEFMDAEDKEAKAEEVVDEALDLHAAAENLSSDRLPDSRDGSPGLSELPPAAIAPVKTEAEQVKEEAEQLVAAAIEQQRRAQLDNEIIKQRLVEWMLPDFESRADPSMVNYRDPVQILVDMAEQGANNKQALGISGIIFVLTTFFGMMRNVEWTFNTIWGVRRSRHLLRTIGDYLLITMLLPFVMAAVVGITAALETERVNEILGSFTLGLRGIQFVIICLTFGMLYYVVPNTRVRKRYAMIGGVVAGALWVMNSWAYVTFGMGLARYTMFFATFALFPVFVMWIYTSWIILLLGALLAYAYQNEDTFAMESQAEGASYAYREALGVRTLVEMARRFRAGEPGLTLETAASDWNVPMRLLNETFECLIAAKLVTPCITEPVSYQPARSPETTKIIDVVRVLREAGHDPSLLRQDESFEAVYSGLDAADDRYLNSSISDIVAKIERFHAESDVPRRELRTFPRVL
jgi:membrane protein